MGSVGMAAGMDGTPCLSDAGALFGCTEGALAPGATHGRKCCRTLLLIAPGGGKEPSRVTMGFPGGAEQPEGVFGPGAVAVLGALAAVAMALEALPVNVRDRQEEGVMKPEAQAIDGREVDLVVHGGGGREEALALLHPEDSGEPVGGLRTQERQRGPGTLQDVRLEEADATVADAHGCRGQVLDVFAVQAVTLQRLFGDAVGGCVGALGQQAD